MAKALTLAFVAPLITTSLSPFFLGEKVGLRRWFAVIIGFLGIGSAPEFLQYLMWKKFSRSMKKEIIKNGIIYLKHGDYEYPITYHILKILQLI